MSKPRLVSGIRPTGRPHLGNYLGAIKHFVELQESGDYECLFFVADYHSLTEEFDPENKKDQVIDLAASFLAAGIDPDESSIFLQSDVPAHTEMAWILGNITSFGRLKRMTQFKEKSKTQKENINLGLFSYPVLMAADVLLYDAESVPVGEDQVQHLELTRDLADRFNSRFGDTLTKPEPVMTEVPRLKDLKRPEDKMSKSSPGGCLFIDDDPETIKDKIMSAVTDSENSVDYAPDSRPGISNLVLIYSSLSGKSTDKVVKDFEDKGYAEFKEALAELVTDYFEDYRKRKKEFMKNRSDILNIIQEGKNKAGEISSKKLKEVKKRIGV